LFSVPRSLILDPSEKRLDHGGFADSCLASDKDHLALASQSFI
jgi:hypothetical protein